MKDKIREFIYSFGLYCLVFLTWHGWDVSNKQIAEMIFLGVWGGVLAALMMNPIRRFIGRVLTKK